MGRIVRLSEAVANQIAAGEVVERPASVVKELVENALDAEATRIDIDIEAGGIDLIRIIDDGYGMTREDALLALERHATSKIREAQDLHSITTLGFRGEALPSIASVSRFTLLTRPRETSEGTRIHVEGGLLKEVATAGAAPGTSIEVRDLFYNVPARRKFLKTAQTEVGHISETISRLALARAEVAFNLSSNNRNILEVAKAATHDPRGRLARILGRVVADRLFPVAPPEKEHAIKVGGFIGAPDLNERTARALHVFVNGRYVRDKTIHHAIQDAYRTLMERGRYPVVLISIDLDPALVDVNVHPQKTEVRFADSGSIHRAVSASISRTLAAQPWLTQQTPSPNARRYQLTPFGGSIANDAPRIFTGRREEGKFLGFGGASSAENSKIELGTESSLDFDAEDPSQDPNPQTFPPSQLPVKNPDQLEARYGEGTFGALEPVGQVMATYLVCQAPGRMVIIDQHAAHERIAFERMKKECAQKAVAEQPLLVPMQLDLDPTRAAIAHDDTTRERLRLIGLELEPFGGNTFVVKSRPAAIGSANLEKLVLDLLDEIKDVGETTPMRENLERLLSCAACHTVVRAGDRLGAAEIKALLRDMDEIDFGAHCPHGRPVFVEWSDRELGALFHRS